MGEELSSDFEGVNDDTVALRARVRTGDRGAFQALYDRLAPALYAWMQLRVRANTRPPQEGEPPLPAGAGRARLTRINKLFVLGEDDEPEESRYAWTGEADLVAEGPPLERPLRPNAPVKP